jgi:hypothetical protein
MGSRPVEVHTSFPDATGKYQIGRMPPGDYIGSAVGGIGVGDEWDPELRKRVESIAQLFSSEKGKRCGWIFHSSSGDESAGA